ncbi:hypothetical protein PMAYCL1PPCAC_23144, partial [Pristionchus mayeri]
NPVQRRPAKIVIPSDSQIDDQPRSHSRPQSDDSTDKLHLTYIPPGYRTPSYTSGSSSGGSSPSSVSPSKGGQTHFKFDHRYLSVQHGPMPSTSTTGRRSNTSPSRLIDTTLPSSSFRWLPNSSRTTLLACQATRTLLSPPPATPYMALAITTGTTESNFCNSVRTSPLRWPSKKCALSATNSPSTTPTLTISLLSPE